MNNNNLKYCRLIKKIKIKKLKKKKKKEEEEAK